MSNTILSHQEFRQMQPVKCCDALLDSSTQIVTILYSLEKLPMKTFELIHFTHFLLNYVFV
jgi:hypothetical protein